MKEEVVSPCISEEFSSKAVTLYCMQRNQMEARIALEYSSQMLLWICDENSLTDRFSDTYGSKLFDNDVGHRRIYSHRPWPVSNLKHFISFIKVPALSRRVAKSQFILLPHSLQ